MIELLRLQELTVSLDPVRAEDRVLSVAFNIVAEMTLPFQSGRLELKECWFEHSALNDFEAQIKALRHEESGRAVLCDMSNKPILRCERKDAEVRFEVIAMDTMGMGRATLEVQGYASEIDDLYQALRDYPKWW